MKERIMSGEAGQIFLGLNENVKMFFKLPDPFKIATPNSSYNPDWAVYVEIDGMKKLYFVLETKESTNPFDLRGNESMKIQCGEAHFRAIGTGAELFGPVKDWKDFKV